MARHEKRIPHTPEERASRQERIVKYTEEDLKLLESEVEKARESRVESDSAAIDELYDRQEQDRELNHKYYEGFHECMEIGDEWRKFNLL